MYQPMNDHPINTFRDILKRIAPRQSELLHKLKVLELWRPISLSPSFCSKVGVKQVELTLTFRDASRGHRSDVLPLLSAREAALHQALNSLARRLSINPSTGALLGYFIALEPLRSDFVDDVDDGRHINRLERCAEEYFADESVALVAQDYAYFTLDFVAAAIGEATLDTVALCQMG